MRTPRTRRQPAVGFQAGEPFVRLAALADSLERHGPRSSTPSTPSTYEERAALLITKTDIPSGMDPESLARVWQRLALRTRGREPAPAGRWLRSPRPWAVVIGALLLSTGGVVAAGMGVWRWPTTIVRTLAGRHPAASGTSAPGPRPAPGRSRGRAGLGDVVASPPAPPAEAPVGSPDTALAVPVAPTPPTVQRPAPRARPERRRTSVDAVPPPASPPAANVTPAAALATAPSALAAESALLASALAHLRQGHDPATTLRALDEYAERFPAGVLAREAQDARIDALLLAGRNAEAGRVLGGLPLGDGARDLELRLIRAELRAAGGACGAALGDFRVVIEQSERAPLAKRASLLERALWGRAACHRRLGDESRARADLSLYLARFPDGPRAAAARAGGDR